MTQDELKKLELNLTKSALKAKKYWVRGMVGFSESDQGFMPIESIPVFNPFKKVETPLAELIEDIDIFHKDYIKLTEKQAELQKQVDEFNKFQSLVNKDVQNQINKINEVQIQELRIVIASLADRLKQLEDETDII